MESLVGNTEYMEHTSIEIRIGEIKDGSGVDIVSGVGIISINTWENYGTILSARIQASFRQSKLL
jgi:hypothetical protein